VPIYEYRCEKCGRKTSQFFQSIAAASQTTLELKCPRCGSPDLRRLFSRFAVGRSSRSEGEEVYDFDKMMSGLDEDDPKSMARWARKMGREMGEDLGPEFDEAMGRIEAGEDPDAVMTELDGPATNAGDEGGFE
jgi:putative FmdB family regulatory protein